MSKKLGAPGGSYNVRQNEIIHTKADAPVKTVKCVVHFLDDTSHDFEVPRSAKCNALLDQVYAHLDLIEKDYFSLQYEDPSDEPIFRWIDPLKNLKKQISSDPPYVLYFRVKFYVTEPTKLQEEYTRYHFFLQIKKDIIDGKLVCPKNVSCILASFAVQSELGDYSKEEHNPGYLSSFRLDPNQDQQFEQEVARYHQQHKGQTPADAEMNYLDRAKHLEMYGADLHKAKDYSGVDILLGVTARGVVVFKNGHKYDVFRWTKIDKISFWRKKFLIRFYPDDNDNEQTGTRVEFKIASYRQCKELWKSCVEWHSFFRLHHIRQTPRRWYQLGSKFRYSGRTEYEAQQDSKRLNRSDRTFQRTGSQSNHLRHTISGTGIRQDASKSMDKNHSSMSTPQNNPQPKSALRNSYSAGAGNRASPWSNSFHLPNGSARKEEDDGGFLSGGGSKRSSFSKRDSLTSRDPPVGQVSNGGHSRENSTASLGRSGHPEKTGYTPRSYTNLNDINNSSLPRQRTSLDYSFNRQNDPGYIPRSQTTENTTSLPRARNEHPGYPPVAPRELPRSHSTNMEQIQRAQNTGNPNSQSLPRGLGVNGFNGGYDYPANSSMNPTTNGVNNDDITSLVTITMKPDSMGRFGFNVRGGVDQNQPIIVSRVAAGMPADTSIPRLNEGDQVLYINGRDVTHHTHEQVVMFIRAARETHSGILELIVRPNVYVGEDYTEPENHYIPEQHKSVSSTSGLDPLNESLLLLREGIESGASIIQFEQLYRRKPGLTYNFCKVSENINKNRYRDISPYDQTRVILRNLPSGDYINANYVNMEIPGSGIINRYIAAQGPLPNTCADFWEMVWQEQITLVVMLTALVERGRVKCHQYWPHLYETTDFGNLQLTCLREKESRSFAYREFTLVNMNTQEERHIFLMQYIAWPDHGVPEDSSDFLDFIIRVRQKRVGMVEPTLVHCSAGIGRTGVLILMETAMCLIEANQPVYPLDIVRLMRDQRAMLIQTSGQYKFVCDAILRVYSDGLVKPLDDFRS